jgi:GTP-binding protein
MMAAVEKQAPPKVGLFRPKLRYAHQGGINPPRIIIHGNALDRVPDNYKRYLEGYFRKEFKLVGTPMAIEFRTKRNPYAGKDKVLPQGKARALRDKKKRSWPSAQKKGPSARKRP